MKRRFWFNVNFVMFTFLAILCVPSAFADFTGTSSGIFENPVGDLGMVTTGVGTSNFTWGNANGYGTGPNSLTFTGIPFTSIPAGQEFDYGTISYFNGTTATGTNATGGDLLATLTFTVPGSISPQSFTFDIGLFTTPNTTGTLAGDADYLTLNNPAVPSTTFTVGSDDYTLEFTRFGNLSVTGGSISGDQFNVWEGYSASADLFGEIIPPSQYGVPEPSTMLLLGLGLIGVAGIRRRFKN